MSFLLWMKEVFSHGNIQLLFKRKLNLDFSKKRIPKDFLFLISTENFDQQQTRINGLAAHITDQDERISTLEVAVNGNLTQ